jgi:hypothetical protein
MVGVCCDVAPEGSVVAGLARGTAYKGAVLPRVSTFLLFVLDILSGNRRIELSSCSAPTVYLDAVHNEKNLDSYGFVNKYGVILRP